MLNTNGPSLQSNREHKFFEKYLDNNLEDLTKFLEEKYKLQQQEINQLRLRVLTNDNSLRKDIEDLKAKVNPAIKYLKK
jgi:hypothetical protein